MTDEHFNNSPEIWKAIPGFPYYEASTHGRIRSWKNNRHGRAKFPKNLKQIQDCRGVFWVSLCNDGTPKPSAVGRLVLTTFVGPRPDKMECCHWDDDGSNNKLINLRWDYRQSNVDDRTRNGNNPCGVRNGHAKLTENQVKEIRNLYGTRIIKQQTIACMFNVSKACVAMIVGRKRWKHI